MFKDPKSDGRYKDTRPIVNETTLLGYNWLDEKYRPYRGVFGVDTLLVTPRQKGRYYSKGQMNDLLSRCCLKHFDCIPRINSESEFPGLAITAAKADADTVVEATGERIPLQRKRVGGFLYAMR